MRSGSGIKIAENAYESSSSGTGWSVKILVSSDILVPSSRPSSQSDSLGREAEARPSEDEMDAEFVCGGTRGKLGWDLKNESASGIGKERREKRGREARRREERRDEKTASRVGVSQAGARCEMRLSSLSLSFDGCLPSAAVYEVTLRKTSTLFLASCHDRLLDPVSGPNVRAAGTQQCLPLSPSLSLPLLSPVGLADGAVLRLRRRAA